MSGWETASLPTADDWGASPDAACASGLAQSQQDLSPQGLAEDWATNAPDAEEPPQAVSQSTQDTLASFGTPTAWAPQDEENQCFPNVQPPPQEPNLVRLGATPGARDIREALLALPDVKQARFDASEVERLSGSVLQVILVAIRQAATTGARLAVINPTFAFSLTFEAYGLGGENEPYNVEYC